MALHTHPGVEGGGGQVALPAPVQEDDAASLRASLLAAAPPEALPEAGAQRGADDQAQHCDEQHQGDHHPGGRQPFPGGSPWGKEELRPELGYGAGEEVVGLLDVPDLLALDVPCGHGLGCDPGRLEGGLDLLGLVALLCPLLGENWRRADAVHHHGVVGLLDL